MQRIKHHINNTIKGMHLYSFGLLRRLYDWTLSWAKTPYGAIALFILAFAESSFFPIPPDILLIALCVSIPAKSFRYALICSFGSVIGGMFGYLIGLGFYETIGSWIISALHYEHYFELVGRMYADNAFMAIFAAAFTPIPYKVFTIAAGVWKINFLTLVSASLIGRSIRFFAVAALIYFYGAKIKYFIDKYFNALTIIFFLLLLGGFLIIKFLL
jgi:membrane protein YqaA with SNARE-associated domain